MVPLEYFVEVPLFDFNLLTLSFVVLALLSIWQTYEYTGQAIKVWREKSAESASLAAFTGAFFILSAFAWYGFFEARSIVITINGLTALPALVVMVGLAVYGPRRVYDWMVFGIGFAGLAAFALPIDPKVVFLTFSLAVTLLLWDLLAKLKQAGNRGVLKGKLLLSFFVKNFFYTIFAFVLPGREPVLQFMAPLWLVLSAWLMWKWWQSPPAKEKGLTK
jgi:uncharacterized protein with PQ loop repeat